MSELTPAQAEALADKLNLPKAWVDQADSDDPNDPDVAIRFSSNLIGHVYKIDRGESPEGAWIWRLMQPDGSSLKEGWAYTKDQGQRCIETVLPHFEKDPADP